MIAAALLVAALVTGKIALGALTIAQIGTLAGAGISVAEVAAKIAQDIHNKAPAAHSRHTTVHSDFIYPHLCFHGAPSGQGARVCDGK